jgi:hypothetical protein
MRLRGAASYLVLPATLIVGGGPDPTAPDDTEYALGCTGSLTSSSIPLPNAVLFADPQGFYEMEVDRRWPPSSSFADAGVESWFVAGPVDGSSPVVVVFTQGTPANDLDEYLELSIALGPAQVLDFELVGAGVVEGGAEQLGVVEYTGTTNDRLLHFLTIVALRDRTAVLAGFAAPPAAFDELRCEVEPYLLTLRSTEPPG